LNVMGTQFHPEKSGGDGLRVYSNFLAVCGAG
jgi:imidazoleglycerol phosphate synthase glutamine amidotransferase subunit HisH